MSRQAPNSKPPTRKARKSEASRDVGRPAAAPTATATATATTPLVGRAEAATILGRSDVQVRRLEQQGRLRAVVDGKGRHLYRKRDVHALRAARERPMEPERPASPELDGETCATVFDLLDENVLPIDIVKRQRLAPDLVRAILREWSDMRGVVFLTRNQTDALKAAAPERHVALFDDKRLSLFEALSTVVSETGQPCEKCERRPAALCRSCSRAFQMGAVRGAQEGPEDQ
jgi:hypothetical protein